MKLPKQNKKCTCKCHLDGMSFCVKCIKLHKKQKTGKSVTIRVLQKKDLENGFFETLSEFRNISGLEYLKAHEIFQNIKQNKFHKVFVAVKNDTVIGCVTAMAEPKFIHNGGIVIRLEDFVVRKEFRGKGIAKKLFLKVMKFAKEEHHAYKIILNCNDSLVAFWEKQGFKQIEKVMRLNLRIG